MDELLEGEDFVFWIFVVINGAVTFLEIPTVTCTVAFTQRFLKDNGSQRTII